MPTHRYRYENTVMSIASIQCTQCGLTPLPMQQSDGENLTVVNIKFSSALDTTQKEDLDAAMGIKGYTFLEYIIDP